MTLSENTIVHPNHQFKFIIAQNIIIAIKILYAAIYRILDIPLENYFKK